MRDRDHELVCAGPVRVRRDRYVPVDPGEDFAFLLITSKGFWHRGEPGAADVPQPCVCALGVRRPGPTNCVADADDEAGVADAPRQWVLLDQPIVQVSPLASNAARSPGPA
jgi:hypothetical protein